MIKLSVVLVTRNRPDRLAKALFSLSLQNVQPYEIIVSDDSNEADKIEENQALCRQYGCRYLSGPQKGLYANRNFGARQVTGSHFRTMDDDHEFPEGHIEACIKAIKEEPDTIWVIGEFGKNVAEREKPYPVPGQLHPKGHAYKPENIQDYFGLSCGGTIYPRQVIDKNHLNVESYKFGVVYLEYGARLKYLGYTLKVLPATYIIHDNSLTTASELSSSAIHEARIYSMLCLSFKYQPSLKNKMLTLFQLGRHLAGRKWSFREVMNAYKEFRLVHRA